MSTDGGFEAYIQHAARRNQLVLQPRMGFGLIAEMQEGLQAVKAAQDAFPRVGTMTIDAYTRVGRPEKAAEALREGRHLNGFPLISHGVEDTRKMLEGLRDPSFPVQVRHGTPFPQPLFEVAAAANFDAIEGGPVSYNLPYSRAQLKHTIEAWATSSRFWAEHGDRNNVATHIESFGGCMFGQLCPPSLPLAISLLEGLFFVENGIQHLSLSLAQGTNDTQDAGALIALRRLASHYLDGTSWHVVYYTFMGLFPQTERGAEAIIRASARIAVRGGAQRLIVKTAAEATGIPTIAQNIQALYWARNEADGALRDVDAETEAWADEICAEADALIQATLAAGSSLSTGLLAAFRDGILDVPYCTHPDNRNRTRVTIHPETKSLLWGNTGSMPIPRGRVESHLKKLNSSQFYEILNLNRYRYDIPLHSDLAEAEHEQ